MLVAGLALTDDVAHLLGRAMAERSREAELGAYGDGGARSVFGWYVGGVLVCVAGVSARRPDAEILHLASEPASERRGHARDLVRALLDQPDVGTLVAETDHESVGFYRRAGFAVEPVTSPWPGARHRCTLRR